MVGESAADACERQLRSTILRREVPPGSRLPPERELAHQLGVHRGTLRSALSRLVAGGLLEQRQGRGTTVRDYLRWGGPELIPGIAELATQDGRLPEVAADLLLVRRHLARAVLERLAAARPDPAPVVAAVGAFAAVAASAASPADLAAADAEVVAALLAASGSPVLQLCLNPVASVVARLPALQQAMYRSPSDNVAAYGTLLAWLHAPDPARIDDIVALLAARDRATVATLATPQ